MQKITVISSIKKNVDQDLSDLLTKVRQAAQRETGMPFASIGFEIVKGSRFHKLFRKASSETGFNFTLVAQNDLDNNLFLVINDKKAQNRLSKIKGKKSIYQTIK